MFVMQAKYDRLEAKFYEKKIELNAMTRLYNRLVTRVNKKGGEQFLRHATLRGRTQSEFSNEDIKKLISLCHPDKHNGKKSSVEITQKLLELRT